MCKTLYEITKNISDKITQDPDIAPDVQDIDASKCIQRTLKAMASLLKLNIQNKQGEKHNIPDKLADLVEIEVLYTKKNTSKAKKTTILIKDIKDNNWYKIKADDLRSFFLPIFNSDYIKNEEYYQDFENKLNYCLDYYSKINPNSIPPYIPDDIISFINCAYDPQKKLPTRDYKKLLEVINSGEV